MLSRVFRRRSTIACLDFGSYQVRALVASIQDDGRSEVLGVGACRSLGIRNGIIHDIPQASECLTDALALAETQAGVKASEAFVTAAPESLRSFLMRLSLPIPEGRVARHHIQQAEQEARNAVAAQNLTVLHAIPVSFELDGLGQTDNPIEQTANHLSATFHLVALPAAILANIQRCCDYARLTLRAVVAAGYASGLSGLTPDQRKLGAALVDLGGDTSSLALFVRGKLVHTSVLPLGGLHMTRTIADTLQIPLEDAEMRKTRRAQLVGQHHHFAPDPELPSLFSDTLDGNEINEICASGHATILQRIAEKLAQPSLDAFNVRRLVLSGGGATLQGLRFFAEDYFPGYRIDLHHHDSASAAQALFQQSAFSAVYGLLSFAQSLLRRRARASLSVPVVQNEQILLRG